MPRNAKPAGAGGQGWASVAGYDDSSTVVPTHRPVFDVAYQVADEMCLDTLAAAAVQHAWWAGNLADDESVTTSERSILQNIALAHRLRLIERARAYEIASQPSLVASEGQQKQSGRAVSRWQR